MYKFLAIFLIFGSLLVFLAAALQAEGETPEFRVDDVYLPKYLPPHPLYFAKLVRDDLQLVFAFAKANKAQKHLDITNKRVLEMVGLAQRGDFSSFSKLLSSYQRNWRSFFVILQKMKKDEFDIPSQKARRNFKKQQEILAYLVQIAPVEIKPKILNVLENQKIAVDKFFNEFQGIGQLEEFKKSLED